MNKSRFSLLALAVAIVCTVAVVPFYHAVVQIVF